MKARPITRDEFDRTVGLAEDGEHGPRNAMVLLLTGGAGMRLGEVGGLDLKDVWDPTTNKVRRSIHLVAGKSKTRIARDIHLSTRVRRAIKAYIRERGTKGGPLVLTRFGGRFHRVALVSLVKGLYRDAGIETSSHAGRALFINLLDDNRTPIRVIQKAVGHRSLASTQAYLSAPPSAVAAAVEAL